MVQVGDVFNYALNQSLFGQQVINTGAMRVSAVPANTTEQAFITSMFGTAGQGMSAEGGYLGHLADLQTTQVTYKNWFVSRVQPNPTTVFNAPVLGVLGGVAAGDCETANIALSITRKGLNAGARNKGRIAVAGVPTTSMAAGQFSTEAFTLATILARDLWGPITAVAGMSATLGFWVPAHVGIRKGQPVNYPAQYVDCVDANAQRTVRVQRSRTVGVGR